MNLFKEYRSYLADNPEGYWFKRKLYGYGWTPARWQGWAVTGLYLLVVIGLLVLSSTPYELISPEALVVPVLALTTLLVALCWKTGEPPRWQWGIDRSQETE